jgi:MFS superfamily sulfate permease-like transporter
MLARLFPFLCWFKNYDVGSLRIDAISGLTVALVLIPQSMAYAQLAGLPAYYGLYASFLPPMIAALFGSSRQLATGPVAVVSLMTAASLEPLATAGGEAYIAYAILLAVMVGAFQFAVGALRLGLVVNFLSHPVVNGFTNAAAFIIASSQLSKIFGVHVDKAAHHYETILRVIETALSNTHWPTFFIGVLAFGIMYGLKRFDPRIPYVLVAVVVTTLISWISGFQHNYEAPISAIESVRARRVILEYNATVSEITKLASQQTEISHRILQARANPGSNDFHALNLKHELASKELQSDVLKKKSLLYRKELRGLRFLAHKDARGELHFYLKEDISQGLQVDGRSWRIAVGDPPPDESSLLFKGGGSVLGDIPRGLPELSMPELNGTLMLRLFPYAIIISLLGFMEAISVAKAMAARTGQRLDPNQELIGQGLANIFGAFGKGYPVSGSFSRSAINLQAGAATGLSSVFTSLTVVVVLLFFTPLLYYLPQSVLAAVIMMAVLGLINVSGLIHAWRAQWYDGAIAIITFVSTLAFAPHLDKGILIGVGFSILVFLYKSMRPRVAILSRYRDGAYHDACTYNLRQCEHIAMVRFDGPLFFANATYLEDQIAKVRQSMPKLKHILIEASGMDDMDATGEEALSLIVDRIRSAGYEISFTGLKKNVLDVMERTFLYEKIGSEHIFPTQTTAIESIYKQAHRATEERECPLTRFCPLSSEPAVE